MITKTINRPEKMRDCPDSVNERSNGLYVPRFLILLVPEESRSKLPLGAL